MVRHQNTSKFHLNKKGTQVWSNVFAESLRLQIENLCYIVWLVIIEIIVISMILMKIKLSLRSVQLVQVI